MATQGKQLVENRYELEGLRERYASVEIYDAHDRQLDRRVSLQVLAVPAGGVPPENEENEEFVKEFVTRQCAASSVYHCQILAVYDAGEWRGRPYSVMEKLGERTALSMQAEEALDLDGALRITRQVAEALQCCRGEGLHTWTFAPQAVRVDDEGNARLAIIEGLGGEGSSSRARTDPAALGHLLRMLLVGQEDKPLPVPVQALLDKLAVGGALTAGMLVAEIRKLEQGALQPTQANMPALPAVAPRMLGAPVPAARVNIHDAPTLMSAVIPSASTSHGIAGATPPGGETVSFYRSAGGKGKTRSRLFARPLMVGVAAVLLALIGVAMAWPRPSGAVAQKTTATPVTVVGQVVVPSTATPTPRLFGSAKMIPPAVTAPPTPEPTPEPTPQPTLEPTTEPTPEPTPEPAFDVLPSDVPPAAEPEPEPEQTDSKKERREKPGRSDKDDQDKDDKHDKDD